MRAYHLDKPRSPLQLQDTPQPAVGPGQILVEVRAVSVHPVDLETRSGKNGMLLPHKRPFVPGVDFVGRALRVGEGVDDLEVGARVFGYRGIAQMGAFAEQLAAGRDEVARVPEGFSDVDAAAFPLPALCAMQALDAVPGEGPKRVLVHGGAGGVGSVAVQVLSALGHHVTATANGRDAAWVRSIGAAEVVDYTTSAFEEHVQGVDLVLDTVGGETLKRSFAVVAQGGVVASLNATPSAQVLRDAGLRVPGPMALLLPLMGWSLNRKARAVGATFVPQVTVPSGARLRRAVEALAARGFEARIGEIFPFEELNQAMDRVEQRAVKGRAVVRRA